jgi:hypothetical protein
VWTPNLRGVIATDDRAEILISLRGPSVQEATAGGGLRAILTRVELLGDDERYQWLNTTFIVGEGEIDEETEAWWVQAYGCINEVVEHPPAIGQAPPEGFRQADR